MSSTTQNNEQKRKAVEYIQQIEDILQGNMNSRYDKAAFVRKQIRDKARKYPGVCEELTKNMHSESSRVILPGKQNKNYNSIELITKWPLSRVYNNDSSLSPLGDSFPHLMLEQYKQIP